MLGIFKLFSRKPTLIDKANINSLSQPYKDSKVYYCGFDHISGGSFFSSGKNIHDQSIIVLSESGVKVLSADGVNIDIGYGGFSVYYKSQQIVLVKDNDVIVCWSFLTLEQLNLQANPDSKNITDLNNEIQMNIREIESMLIQNGGKKEEVSE